MGDLSAHFSRSEFACKGSRSAGHTAHATVVRPELVELLERLRRDAGDRPLHIVSGYRCQMWNEHVGGAPASEHLRGAAADLEDGYITFTRARALGASGIGRRGIWAVHVDVRLRPAVWRY